MAKLSARGKSRLYSNLEKYACSGMGMEKACDSLLQQPRVGASERRVYESIRTGVGQGLSIGASLGNAVEVVSLLEVEVVSAAEEGGQLEKGFGHLAEYFKRVDQTRRRIFKGLTYPIILMHLAIPACAIAVAAFGSFSMDGPTSDSPFQDAFLETGQVMVTSYLVVAILVVLAMILHRLGRTSPPVDGLLNSIPLVGKARRAVSMERFSQVFEIFLLSGQKMSDTLKGASRASGSGSILAAGQQGVPMIEDGDLLTTALHASASTFPGDFLQGVAAAEEAGALDREMAEWGRYYSDEAREAMEQVAEWTPKLFYWGILIVVAWLMIRAALAYQDLIENLLNFSF